MPACLSSLSRPLLRLGAVWALVSVLTACGLITSKAAPRSAPLERPRSVATEGPYRHEGSGLTFPAAVGDLKRKEITQYDESGYDVGAAYASSPPALQYTVYIYPGPNMDYIKADPALVESSDREFLLGELERVSGQITSRHQVIDLESQGELATPGIRGHYRSWTFDQPTLLGPVKLHTTVRLGLWDHRWYVKVRATGPQAKAAQIDSESDALLEALTGVSP